MNEEGKKAGAPVNQLIYHLTVLQVAGSEEGLGSLTEICASLFHWY